MDICWWGKHLRDRNQIVDEIAFFSMALKMMNLTLKSMIKWICKGIEEGLGPRLPIKNRKSILFLVKGVSSS